VIRAVYRRVYRLALVLGTLAGSVGCASLEELIPVGPTSFEGEIHERVNRHRIASGLPPLTSDPRLDAIARAHSESMAQGRRPFGHDGFDDRVAAARTTVGVNRMAENVAWNDFPRADAPRRVVEGWLGSPGHRRNIDERAFTLTGIGVASSGGRWYVTQLYAAR
jgi:uncharacterized protein YkwD